MTPSLAQAFFHSAAPKFLEYVAVPAVRALLVGCAAALALAALRVKRPPARLQVWTAVLCAALAMPFLGIALPQMPLAIPARLVATNVAQVLRPESFSTPKSAASNAAQARPKHSERIFRPDASERISVTPRRREATILTPKSVSYIERATERRMAQADSMRGASSQATALGMDVQSDAAEMPVMPLPVIPVVADNFGISPAQILRTFANIALGIYAFIALILLARLFAGVWFSRKLGRAAQEIEPLYFGGADDAQNAQAREALRLLRFRSSFAALKSAPALRESAAISVPATVGVRRAAILLPLNWRAWSVEQLDAVLAHEVSHVARRDALVQALSLVHRAIFWFSPLAWWLDRQLTELAEQASDEAALAGGADRTRYAETLLGFFAQLENTRGRIWWQGVSMAKKSHAGRAERRVDRILAWKEGMSVKKSFVVAVGALAVPVIFFAASLHPVIAYGQDKTQSDSQNVIMPGGPKAPALPNAPRGGVNGGVVAPAIAPAPQAGGAAPALPPAPHGGVPSVPAVALAPQGGVVAPAIAPAPGTPFAPSTPAPRGGVNGGVVTPAMPPAPTGPRAVRPSTPIPHSAVAPMSPSVSASSMVSTTTVQAGVGAGSGAGSGFSAGVGILHPDDQQYQDIAAQLRAALDELERADSQSVKASAEQMAETLAELKQAQESSDAAAHDQMLATLHALEKAQRLAQQNDSSQMSEARRALAEAMRDLHEARKRMALADARHAEEMSQRTQEMAARDSQHAQEMGERAQEMAQRDAERKQETSERAAERAQGEAERAQEEAGREQDSTRTVNINGGSYTMGGGSRYVMFTGGNNVDMSGDEEDLHHAQNLRKKLGKDLIWFERDEKSYVITDPAFIAKAQALFAPEEALSKQQDELGRQQDELGRQQDALGEQMDKVSVKPPDVTEDLQRVQARLKELQATGATQRELGELQSELGRLQSEVGRVQSQAGVQQSAIGRQQGELGRKQGELGRKQGELGRQEAAISREANRQLRGMLDDAIKSGVAKPE